MAPEVRRAVPGDIEQIVGSLERAFFDDPVARYLFPIADARAALLERFFHLQLEWNYLPHGEVFTVEGGQAASLWLGPDARAATLRERAALTQFALTSPSRYLAMRRLGAFLARRHPTEPHYYLGTIGTDPAVQGNGVGTALLRPILERCDAMGVPVYLECSRLETTPFYARQGFIVRQEVRLPQNGPRLFLMWRAPRGGWSSS